VVNRKLTAPFVGKAYLMKTLIFLMAWCILFVLCWPVALLALLVFPLVWLLSLPLRLVGITVGAFFALFRAILYLPARLLGWRGRSSLSPRMVRAR
jgi:hypothetical protein